MSAIQSGHFTFLCLTIEGNFIHQAPVVIGPGMHHRAKTNPCRVPLGLKARNSRSEGSVKKR